jgi:hypothetical protein
VRPHATMLYKYLLAFLLALSSCNLTSGYSTPADDDMPSIFIPLYVYPTPGAWDFLYDL